MRAAATAAPHYRIHGCTIASEVALDLPAATPGVPTDVHVTLGSVAWQPTFDEAGRDYREQSGHALLAWEGIGRARVRRNHVELERAAGADPDLLRQFLLGPITAALMRQRGRLAFHASSVAGAHGAVGFLGWCGWGKSTTAAGLHARGWEALGDDLLVVDTGGAEPMAQPGAPHYRLDGNSCDLLEISAPSAAVPAARRKRRLPVSCAPAATARPLRLMVVLNGEADDPVRLPLVDAWTELTRHAFTIRALDTELQAAHMAQVAALAQRVPVISVRVPRGEAAFPWVESVVASYGVASPRGRIHALGA